MARLRNWLAIIFFAPAMILGTIGFCIAHKSGRNQVMIGLIKAVSKVGE